MEAAATEASIRVHLKLLSYALSGQDLTNRIEVPYLARSAEP